MTDDKLSAEIKARVEVAQELETNLIATSLYLEKELLPKNWSVFILAFETLQSADDQAATMLQMITTAMTAEDLTKLRNALRMADERLETLETAIREKKPIPLCLLPISAANDDTATKH